MYNHNNWQYNSLQQQTFYDSNLQYLEENQMENAVLAHLDNVKSIVLSQINLRVNSTFEQKNDVALFILSLKKDIVTMCQAQEGKLQNFEHCNKQMKHLSETKFQALNKKLQNWIKLANQDDNFFHSKSIKTVYDYFDQWLLQVLASNKKKEKGQQRKRSYAFCEKKSSRQTVIYHQMSQNQGVQYDMNIQSFKALQTKSENQLEQHFLRSIKYRSQFMKLEGEQQSIYIPDHILDTGQNDQ